MRRSVCRSTALLLCSWALRRRVHARNRQDSWCLRRCSPHPSLGRRAPLALASPDPICSPPLQASSRKALRHSTICRAHSGTALRSYHTRRTALGRFPSGSSHWDSRYKCYLQCPYTCQEHTRCSSLRTSGCIVGEYQADMRRIGCSLTAPLTSRTSLRRTESTQLLARRSIGQRCIECTRLHHRRVQNL
jgi:hypothetical protein